jgi:DNA-binding transcriptional LysR family regulator
MSPPDLNLNLLITLDALLAEGSVAGAAAPAAQPLGHEPALARLRDTPATRCWCGPDAAWCRRPGDRTARPGQPAGAGRQRRAAPCRRRRLGQLERTFTLRTSEGFVENFGPALIARAGEEAPACACASCANPTRTAPRCDGSVDLETGVVGKSAAPELRVQALFRDRFIGVVQPGHDLARGEVTPARYAAGRHIRVERPGRARGAIDDALDALGLTRRIITLVDGFAAALALARASDLIASVPERHTGILRSRPAQLPAALPEITVSLLWHPRLDADPAHRWLRGLLRAVCGAER